MFHNKYFYLISLLCVSRAAGDCTLSLKQDFSQPSPVFIKDGAYLRPNATSGYITLGRSETILVGCTGSRRKVVLGSQTTAYDVMEAHCIIDSTFRVDRWIGPFKDIKCSMQADFTSEEVQGGCGQGRKLYRVGYEVKSKFYELYEACFDPVVTETVYVKNTVEPSNIHIDSTGARPQFVEGGIFDTVSMADIYKIKSQQERIKSIVGSHYGDYISNTEYLARGHLAPRADFSLRAEQRASFHYINTAPQWMKANAGPWFALEEGLRKRVHNLGYPVTVYTGPLGVSSLDGHPFYLGADKNNNGVVPVPMYFFKLVYDHLKKEAVAFIAINSSYLNSTSTEDLNICASVCDQYPWLKWREDGNMCCTYQALASKARLPKLDVKGRLIL